MIETMIPPQVGMRHRTSKKRERPNEKKERPNKKEKKRRKKLREKERRDNATILFTTLVLHSSTMIFMIESFLFCHFHILVAIFHYRTWLMLYPWLTLV